MGSDNFRKFRWSEPAERAALDLAEDDLSDIDIAARAGITDRQLRNWKKHPEFAARVADHVERLQAAMLRYRVAKRRERVKTIDDLHTRLLTIVDKRADEYRVLAEQRASDPAPASDLDRLTGRRSIPAGGETGLLVRKVKQVGQLLVEEFAFDEPVFRAIVAAEEQAAKELGQWVEKKELTGDGGGPLTVVIAPRADGPQ